ncbi:leucine-rich repeat-containing protein 70 [Tribolium castaneum]|nr:PREDICTED: leucine-rich repeat-containing protein let-4-like [Tribolium castaneum]|eukprot:XP_008201325.1 PREDICTED: leucine-rich repeat-containing protein let-4-like [Tribolium castaneum]
MFYYTKRYNYNRMKKTILFLSLVSSAFARCQWSALPGKRVSYEIKITCTSITSKNIIQEVSSGLTQTSSSYRYIFENSSIQNFPMNVFASNKKGNVLYLYLNSSEIETIQTGAFSGLLEVKEIYLQFNSLTVVSRGCFNSLLKLKILDLSNNNIFLIEDEAFNGSNELEKILLDNNNITHVPQSMFHSLKQLKFIDLSNNSIKLFDLTFSNFAVHKTIFLNNNKIYSVNCGSLHSSFLDVIELKNNYLTEADGSCFPLIAEQLNLKHNHITNISSLSTLENLKSLDLSYNYITNIDTIEFRNLKKLENLQLEHNNITQLPPGVFKNLTSLRVLNLSENSLKYLEFGVFNGLQALRTLDISYNQLDVLEEDVFINMRYLKVLNVSYNHLQYINLVKLASYTALEQIHLIGNNITCQKLSSMFSYKLKIKIGESNYHNVSNVNGVPCTNFNLLLKTNENKINYNNVFQDVRSFFNTDFKNTSFFKFFSEDLEPRNRLDMDIDVKKLNHDFEQLLASVSKNNVIFIIFTLIVVVMCVLLAILVVLVKNQLKHQPFSLREPEMHLL